MATSDVTTVRLYHRARKGCRQVIGSATAAAQELTLPDALIPAYLTFYSPRFAMGCAYLSFFRLISVVPSGVS